jgi:hypothetical protein
MPQDYSLDARYQKALRYGRRSADAYCLAKKLPSLKEIRVRSAAEAGERTALGFGIDVQFLAHRPFRKRHKLFISGHMKIAHFGDKRAWLQVECIRYAR